MGRSHNLEELEACNKVICDTKFLTSSLKHFTLISNDSNTTTPPPGGGRVVSVLKKQARARSNRSNLTKRKLHNHHLRLECYGLRQGQLHDKGLYRASTRRNKPITHQSLTSFSSVLVRAQLTEEITQQPEIGKLEQSTTAHVCPSS